MLCAVQLQENNLLETDIETALMKCFTIKLLFVVGIGMVYIENIEEYFTNLFLFKMTEKRLRTYFRLEVRWPSWRQSTAKKNARVLRRESDMPDFDLIFWTFWQNISSFEWLIFCWHSGVLGSGSGLRMLLVHLHVQLAETVILETYFLNIYQYCSELIIKCHWIIIRNIVKGKMSHLIIFQDFLLIS